MGATTVRVDERTKSSLDKLMGLVQAETGTRLTYAELLGRLLRLARQHEGELLLGSPDDWAPPSPLQLERVLRRAKDWGVRTDAGRVDDELYGGSPHA